MSQQKGTGSKIEGGIVYKLREAIQDKGRSHPSTFNLREIDIYFAAVRGRRARKTSNAEAATPGFSMDDSYTDKRTHSQDSLVYTPAPSEEEQSVEGGEARGSTRDGRSTIALVREARDAMSPGESVPWSIALAFKLLDVHDSVGDFKREVKTKVIQKARKVAGKSGKLKEE